MAEAQAKMKHDVDIKTPKMPLGARLYQGWVGVISRLKSNPIDVKSPRGAAARKRDWSHGRGSIYTSIPPITDASIQEIGFYSSVEPFSYIRATYNSTTSEYLLSIIEPTLTEDEEKLLNLIKETLEKTLEYEWEKLSLMDKKTYLEKSVDSYIKSRGISIEPVSKDKVTYFIARDFVGYGTIDALMNDTHMEDVSCDGVGIPLFVFHNKYESIKTNIQFADENVLNSFVINLGQRCGKQLSVSNPILDGTTPEGHRVQATYAREVTTRGASFTIRRFKEKPFTPVELIKYGTASPEIVAYLWLGVEHGESAIICGGTASGKTATLNAMSLFIPPGAKVVSMEDTREINLPHENWIPGTTRSGVGERGADGKAAGEIDMYDLVRAALRQRPNYIIVGEVRGKETYTMFQAMATGHTTFSTMHADSVKGMVNRLENPPINCPRILLTALRNVIIQTHARVGMDMVRRIKQLIEIVGFEPETNELISNTVYEWDQATDKFIYKGHSFLFDKIMEMKNLTHEELLQEFERRVDIVKYMVSKDIEDHREIWGLIREYYKDSKATTEMVRKALYGSALKPDQTIMPGGEVAA
jgi:flagellar protein FlaI